MSERSSRRILAVILCVFAIAAAFGMRADLPFSRAATETEQVWYALKFGSGDLNPHYFLHPPFFAYILLGFFGIFFVAGSAAGAFRSMTDFERLVFADPTVFYLIARCIVLLLALAAVVVFCRAARKLYARASSALLACALLCSTPVFVCESHYGTADILMMALSLLAFLVLSRLLTEDTAADYAWAGFLIGLASAAKYIAAFLIIPLAAAHVLGARARDRGWAEIIWSKRLLLGLALSAVGFLVGCPYALLDPKTFLKSLAEVQWCTYSTDYHFTAYQAKGPGLLYMMRTVLPNMMGWPLTILSSLGLLYGLWRRQPADLLLASWILPYTLMLTRATMMQGRYLLHVMPFMLLMGVRMLSDGASRLGPGRAQAGSLVLAACLLAWPSWRMVWTFDSLVAQRPPAAQAVEWAARNIPSGTAVATLCGIGLMPNDASIDRQLAEIRARSLGAGTRLRRMRNFTRGMPAVYDVYSLPYPWREDFAPGKWDYPGLLRKGVRYFILTEEADEYLADPARYKVQVEFLKAVRSACRKVWELRQAFPPMWVRSDGRDQIVYVEIFEAPFPPGR